jgi:protein-L-isoaspartate(D-aspartate) O-methyltransferase
LIRELKRIGITSGAVLKAMEHVPRHVFVRREHLELAYENHPLPIGDGQTISQPLVVAHMTEAARIGSGDRVLEVGTGSGYQAAVLAELGARVFSIEINPDLADWAAENLARVGYEDVRLLVGDGYLGWKEHSPYDAIVITAAPDHVPKPLVRQLALGGRLVAPVGLADSRQHLLLVERLNSGIRTANLGPVAFVPMTGDAVNARGT